MDKRTMVPGECAGTYDADWRKTFDMVFLVGWVFGIVALTLVTSRLQPDFYTDYRFMAFAALKFAVMVLMSIAGGLVCRRYCQVDEKGYIVTSKDSWFKVNYTRKLQHFAAYLVPLLNISEPGEHPHGVLPHVWEAMLVLLAFLLMIKPIRERSGLFMLQFNSLDRPEDRPYTLKWIVLGNILPGLALSLFFRELFETHGFADLALIIIFIIGIGDGLAEPVGIYWGRHKYHVPSWFSSRIYVRSVEGSLCVLLTSVLFVGIFYADFHTLRQFWTAVAVVPLLMTVVEATAPHSMDTPSMMIIGFSALYAIIL